MSEDQFRKVRPQEAADLMGVSLRAVYNRIKRYGWKQETDFENRAWIWIPEGQLEDLLKEGSGMVHKPIQQVQNTLPESSNEMQGYLQEEVKTLREALYEEKLKVARLEGEVQKMDQMQKTIDALQEALEAHKTATTALNNERIVIHSALQKVRPEEQKAPISNGFKWPWFKKN